MLTDDCNIIYSEDSPLRFKPISFRRQLNEELYRSHQELLRLVQGLTFCRKRLYCMALVVDIH